MPTNIKSKYTKTSKFSIVCSDALRDILELKSAEEGRPMAQYIRRCLEKFHEKELKDVGSND